MQPVICQLERAPRATVLFISPVDAWLSAKVGTPGVPRDPVG